MKARSRAQIDRVRPAAKTPVSPLRCEQLLTCRYRSESEKAGIQPARSAASFPGRRQPILSNGNLRELLLHQARKDSKSALDLSPNDALIDCFEW